MPKLRNGTTDVAKFADWIGRKIRNHNPLSELKLKADERQKMPRMYKASSIGDVAALAEDMSTILCRGGGRVFEVQVREVPAERWAEEELQRVGS